MSAYRELAERAPPPSPVVGLVRSNGATCTCTAPGRLWRWWYSIQYEDAWYCRHGFGWVWKNRKSPGGVFDLSRWELKS